MDEGLPALGNPLLMARIERGRRQTLGSPAAIADRDGNKSELELCKLQSQLI